MQKLITVLNMIQLFNLMPAHYVKINILSIVQEVVKRDSILTSNIAHLSIRSLINVCNVKTIKFSLTIKNCV